MRLIESTIIDADANAVWPHVADPLLQSEWNPKIVSIARDRDGPVLKGERFEVIYRMSSRERETQVEVKTSQRPERVVFVHRMERQSKERFVEESYEITPHAGGVKVVQTIDLSHAGFPILLRPLIWFIHRFGWSAEEPYLDRLKNLLEVQR